LHERQSTGTCSIGIGRLFGDINWGITVYNVAAADRQDFNIIATMQNAVMDKGQSITVTGVPQAITITNVDNAAVFDYDVPELRAPITDPDNGLTKVQLDFEIKDAGLKWSTDDCYAGSVIFSGGWESWSCDYACNLTAPAVKEL